MEDFSAQPPDFLAHPAFRNDLEGVVAARFPAVRESLEWLRGRAKGRMTGSGGCVFAGFASREEAQRVIDALPPPMQGFVARGLEQHPLVEP